jgi:hypothetical protein
MAEDLGHPDPAPLPRRAGYGPSFDGLGHSVIRFLSGPAYVVSGKSFEISAIHTVGIYFDVVNKISQTLY